MSSKPPLVVPTISRREIIVSVVVALVVLSAIIFGVVKMGNRFTTAKLTGVIELKTFTPRAEDQVTIGKKGVEVRHIEGEYGFEVRAGGKVYVVPVEKEIYDAKKVGERFTFPNPEPGS